MKTSLRTLLVIVIAWALGAAAFLGSGLPTQSDPKTVPLAALGLSIVAIFALFAVRFVREAVAELSIRTLLVVNLVRFAGFAFLWLEARGRLPAEFADRAGWGDIAVAAGAAALLVWPVDWGFRRLLFLWNVAGMLDLFLAVGTAAAFVARNIRLDPMVQLPFGLIPLWIVPILMTLHVAIFRRLLSGESTGSARAIATA